MSCKIISIANQKGGVTKTTTCANLGIGLAMHGKRVLLIDCDPQADLTTALGWQNNDELQITLAEILSIAIRDDNLDIQSSILHHGEGVT